MLSINKKFFADVDFRRVDGQLQAEMQALFEKDDPLALVRAAQLGDETITREFLNKFRNEVLCKYVRMYAREVLWSTLPWLWYNILECR